MKVVILKYAPLVIVILVTLTIYDFSKEYLIDAKSYYKYNIEESMKINSGFRRIYDVCNNRANIEVSSKITRDNIDEWNKVNSICRLKSETVIGNLRASREYNENKANSLKGRVGEFISNNF